MRNYFADNPPPFLGIELQYHRVPHHRWALLLTRLRQLGANAVGTSLCWAFHEPNEDQADLSGGTDPQRDVAGFIDLCGAMGFKVLLRVGPFVEAGLIGGGVPGWLHRQPELQARRHDGTVWRHPASDQPRCTLEHPRFLEHIRRWFEQVTRALGDQQWPDGPIVAVQIDNALPGSGLSPLDLAEVPGLTARERADYNEHVVRVQWPLWLRQRHDSLEVLNAAYGTAFTTVSQVEFPPRGEAGDEVVRRRRNADAHRFIDESFSHALQTYAGILRDLGWQVPLGHNLACLPWWAEGLRVDSKGLAEACDWLGHDVPAAPGQSFADYVHYAHWRTKLVGNYTPEMPRLVTNLGTRGAADLLALFVTGAGAVCLEHGLEVDPDPPAIGAGPRWAVTAPLRPDGSPRRLARHIRTVFTYLAAQGSDYLAARGGARVAIGYTHLPDRLAAERFEPGSPGTAGQLQVSAHAAAGQELARQFIRAGLDFEVVDLDHASDKQLARYQWLLVPSTPLIDRATWRKVTTFAASGGQLGLIGQDLPEYDADLKPYEGRGPASEYLIAPETDWGNLLAGVNPSARASAPDVDVTVRHGDEAVYVAAVNRRSASYRGEVEFRAGDGMMGQIGFRLGAGGAGLATIRRGQLVAAVLCGAGGGEATAGGARFTFEGEAGAVAAVGPSLALAAAERGRFRLMRPEGWSGLQAKRLLYNGDVVDLSYQVRGERLSLDYPVSDDQGQTDIVWLLSDPANLPPLFAGHLTSLLRGRQRTLAYARGRCASLAEALLAQPTTPSAPNSLHPSLAEAERGLSEARAALGKAAASLGALEAEVATIRGEIGARRLPEPVWLDLASLSQPAQARLAQTRLVVKAVQPWIEQTQAALENALGAEALTLGQYLAVRAQAVQTCAQVARDLGHNLGHLRADLAAAALPLAVWLVHDWLEHIIRSLELRD